MKLNQKEIQNNNINIDFTDDISVDFEKVENIALEDIKDISAIHKMAVLNGKNLYIKNAAPEVLNILAITGLNKSFKNFDEHFSAPAKRKRVF